MYVDSVDSVCKRLQCMYVDTIVDTIGSRLQCMYVCSIYVDTTGCRLLFIYV